ncbi:MAG: ABC transporter permease [Candidatus Margulisiibacteriota bacterium]|nr:ABC transporter permease [Candidatus Margulisiibacteriota bacterium]
MNIFESFSMAYKALTGNIMRSILTMLGVIIGVFAVITLVGLGEGAKAYVRLQITQWGTGTNYLELHPWEEGSIPLSSVSEAKLTYEDAMAIKDLDNVQYVDPRVIRAATLRYGRKQHKVPFIMGVSADYPKIYIHNPEQGRFFNEADVSQRRKVALLGKKAANELFGGLSPIGERMKINGDKFTIIGVLEEKGSMMRFDFDDLAVIPVTTAMDVFDTEDILEIGVATINERMTPVAQAEIEQLLTRRHGKKDFRVDSQEETMDMLNSIMGALTGIIGGIAAISLLVGGIGIMNIMLVSVTERIREIGIRKAIGAKRKDIFVQFLVESITISIVGGFIGLVLGVSLSLAIMKFLNLPPTVSYWSVAMALGVSIMVGVGSGVYPAMRAARLDPVDALRYE